MIYLISLFVIILDQLTKGLVAHNLSHWHAVSLFPGLNLVYANNTGVSFSFLSGDSETMPWILSGVALIICVFIVRWMQQESVKAIKVGLALILGGAIGNVIDRVRLGSVIDFIDVYVGSYHWPAFNVADSAICIGVVLILFYSFKKGK